MLGTSIMLAGCTVAAAMVTGSRIFGLKRMVRHSTITDVTFSVGAVAVFAGTLTGALVAVLAGLMMAVLLSMLKKIDSLMQGRTGVVDKVKARWKATDPEFDFNGEWVYNKAPYV